MNDKLALFEDFKSIREDVAFHFTSQKNIESILSEGLRPVIGDNSSGALGQSAIEKTYVSYGLEGVLQLYNRLISASFEQKVGDFRGLAHKPFVPDSGRCKNPVESLSILEGFEMIRQYMEDNVYFIFDATKTEYEKSISDEELEQINDEIKSLEDSGSNICEQFCILNDRITEMVRQNPQENKDKVLELTKERNRLSLLVREKTLPIIDEKRGKLLNENENPIIEEIDYNDERLVWKNQMKNPHNTHTRIIENGGQIGGVRITKDMLKIFSKDGKNPSNGLEFLDAILSQVTPNDRIHLSQDCNLLFKFQEYVQMVEKYKEMGLLDIKPEETFRSGDKSRTIPERQVMDLTNIDKYLGLAEFSEDLEQYYEENRHKKKTKELGKESIKAQKNTESKINVAEKIAMHEAIQERTGKSDKKTVAEPSI